MEKSKRKEEELLLEIESAKERINELEKLNAELVKKDKIKNSEFLQLNSILDSMEEVVYVADPDTYELLYQNKICKDSWGDKIGEKCYKALQNLDSPCEFCTNNKIFGKNIGKIYKWEFQNRITKQWYRCEDRAIKWDNGKYVRFEIAVNLTENKTIEKQLRESKNLYKTLFENAPVGIMQYDKMGVCCAINEEFVNYLGTTREKAIGFNLIKNLNNKEMAEAIENSLQNGIGHFNNYYTSVLGSKKLALSVRFKALYNSKNEIIGGIAIAEDISDIIEKEILLKESEEKFRQLLLLKNAIIESPNGIVIFTLDQDYKYLDFTLSHKEIMKKIWGVEIEVGQNMLDYIKEESDKIKAKENFDRVLSKGESFTLHEEYGDKNKYRTFYEDRYSPILDIDNNIFGVTVSVTDITDRVNAEIKLKESEEKFRKAFITSPDSININRMSDGMYIETNDGFHNITGFSREEAVGKTSIDINIWADLNDRKRLIDELKQKGKVNNFEAMFRKKNGEIVAGLMSAIIININNEPHILTITRDISEIKEVQDSLKRSEERFKKLANLSYEGILIHQKGNAIDVNLAFTKMFGYKEDELIGKYLIPLLIKKKHIPVIEKKIEQTVVLPFEVEGIKKNGTLFPIELESQTYSEGGKEIRVTAVRDLTLRRKYEDELQKLRNAVEQSLVSVVITDLGGNIEYVNKYFCKLTGYSKEEAIGSNPRILKTDYFSKDYYKTLWKTISSGKTWNGELLNKKKNGEYYWEKAVITPIKDVNGKIINYVAIKEDITEWKKTEEDRALLEKVVKNSLNEVYIFDKDTLKFNFVNERVIKNTGYSEKELLEMTPEQLLYNVDNSEVRKMVSPLFTKNIPFLKFELVHKRKDDSIYPVDVSLQIVKHGNYTRLVAIAIDISKRKEAEKEIEKYQTHLLDLVEERTEEITVINELLKKEIAKKEKAESKVKSALVKEKELNQLKDVFLSTVSHDLRTPLAAIFSSIELLERFNGKWDNDKVFHKYEQIKHSVTRITNMLEHILKLSRIKRGKITTKFETINLKNELQHIIEEITLIKNENHKIIFNYLLEKELHLIDINLLSEVITNLLTNAVKYSPDGGIVEFLVEEEENYLVFRISDSGLGIREEDKENIFDDFYRTEGSQNIAGSGLGLSIVKQYVDIYKGKITVDSELGKGSVFTVKIPKIDR